MAAGMVRPEKYMLLPSMRVLTDQIRFVLKKERIVFSFLLMVLKCIRQLMKHLTAIMRALGFS